MTLNIDVTAYINENINSLITNEEILQQNIKNKLKTNNAFSDENIINGFMKSSRDHFIDRSEQTFII